MTPQVLPFHHAGTGTWSYLVWDATARVAAAIDPVLDYQAASARTSSASAQALVDAATERSLRVEWLLETHAHADHLSASHWLKHAHWPHARIAIGRGITRVQARFGALYDLGPDFVADGSQFDRLFDDGDAFAIGTLDVRVIAVPGHTSDSNAYLVGDALFCGDSLFMPDAGTARCDFPGGSAATLYRSIRRLFELPDATRVFVCHDYGKPAERGAGRAPACETSIGEQRRSNIHARDGVDERDYIALREARDATLPMPALILPAVQANIRAGALPPPEHNGIRYFKLPLDAL